MRLKYLALAAAAMPFAPAMAQDADTAVIVVTGRGLEQTPATPAYDVIVLEREQIVSGASGRIEDVLNNVAGFQQFRRSDSRSSNPSAQGVTLRALGGNATSRAQVLLDAVPLADPFFGYIPLSAIAPERLESIRVTRGGGTGPFGAGALAGAIELESADASTLDCFQRAGDGQRPVETDLTAPCAKAGRRTTRWSGRWDRGKGSIPRPSPARAGTARGAFDSWSASAQSSAARQGHRTAMRGLAFEISDAALRRSRQLERRSGLSARLRTRPLAVRCAAHAQWRNFSNIVISSTSFAKTLDQGTPVDRARRERSSCARQSARSHPAPGDRLPALRRRSRRISFLALVRPTAAASRAASIPTSGCSRGRLVLGR